MNTTDQKVICPQCAASVNASDMTTFRGKPMCVWCNAEEKRAERSRS